jgi:hypothetical protein
VVVVSKQKQTAYADSVNTLMRQWNISLSYSYTSMHCITLLL